MATWERKVHFFEKSFSCIAKARKFLNISANIDWIAATRSIFQHWLAHLESQAETIEFYSNLFDKKICCGFVSIQMHTNELRTFTYVLLGKRKELIIKTY